MITLFIIIILFDYSYIYNFFHYNNILITEQTTIYSNLIRIINKIKKTHRKFVQTINDEFRGT